MLTPAEKLKKLQEMKNPALQANSAILERIQSLKGDQGIQGIPGKTPTKGVDYFTPQDIDIIVNHIKPFLEQGPKGDKGDSGINGKNGETPTRGVDYWTPKDQEIILREILAKVPKPKDGVSPNIDDVIKKVTEEIQKKPIEFKDIKGTEQLIAFLKSGGFRGGGGSGGGTLVIGGTGILVTGTGTQADPFVVSTYAAPTITLATVPTATVEENGVTISSVVLNATTGKHSDTITGVTFYRGISLIHTQASPLPNGGLESYTDTTPVTTTTSYTAQVTDGTTTVTSNSATFTFVYPYLYGINSPALAFASMYGSLTHLIATQGTKTVSFAPNSQVMYFGYPATYPDLTSIKDQNNFETISNWTKRTGNITGLDGSSQSYKVYEFNNLTGTGTTISYTFA